MAITTLAGINSGFQQPIPFSKSNSVSANNIPGQWQTYWAVAGNPATGSYDTTLNGVTLSGSSSQVTGQLRFVDPNAGNCYLGRFQVIATSASGAGATDFSGTLILADRLWHNGGISATSTGAQTIVSPTWPARDTAGATSGDGVLLALECSATMGSSGPPTITVSYTNSSGTAGQTGTNISGTLLACPAQTTFLISLQAGDTGVRSVQSITLSASWTSGTINLVAYRPIALLELSSGRSKSIDALSGAMPIMYPGSVPFIMANNNQGSGGLLGFSGILQYTWG